MHLMILDQSICLGVWVCRHTCGPTIRAVYFVDASFINRVRLIIEYNLFYVRQRHLTKLALIIEIVTNLVGEAASL